MLPAGRTREGHTGQVTASWALCKQCRQAGRQAGRQSVTAPPYLGAGAQLQQIITAEAMLAPPPPIVGGDGASVQGGAIQAAHIRDLQSRAEV